MGFASPLTTKKEEFTVVAGGAQSFKIWKSAILGVLIDYPNDKIVLKTPRMQH